MKESFGEGYRLHINFINLLSEENEQLVKELQKRFDTKIVNQLDSRVVVKVDKNVVFECVRWIKENSQVNWMVSQPSLYDVFMNFV